MTTDGLSQAQPQGARGTQVSREAVAPARRQKLQVSLSDDERRTLTARARAGGFDSVAAYIRAAALGRGVSVASPWAPGDCQR